MENHIVLVLGTAPNAFVTDTIHTLRNQGFEPYLVVGADRVNHFTAVCDHIYPIHGRMKWYSPELLRLYLRLKPDHIVIVRGEHWFHDNVLHALHFWRFFREIKTLRCFQGAQPRSLTFPNQFSPSLVAALVLVLAAMVALTPLKPLWGGVFFCTWIGLELVLLLYDQANHFERRRMPASRFKLHNEGELMVTFDPQYGWTNLPNLGGSGHFIIEGFTPPRYSWKRTHNAAGLRITSSNPNQDNDKPLLAIFGCSIPYGQSVDDDQSLPWLLQEQFPNYRVCNYAVGSYSLYQMLMRIREMFETQRPEAVILGFHHELELRCTNSFKDRMYWLTSMQNPAAIYRNGRLKVFKPRGYRYLPFSNHLRSLKLLEYLINRAVVLGRGNRKLIRATSQHLLSQIRALCQKHNAKLLVACVDDAEHYYNFFIDQGFSWCITGITSRETQWTVYPFDGHPGPLAHVRYAQVIGEALTQTLAGRHVFPKSEHLAGHVSTPENDTELKYIYPQF